MLDEVNTSYRHMTIARQEVEKFLSQYSGPLPWPVSLVFFSDKGTSGTTPSRDAKKVIADLKANPAASSQRQPRTGNLRRGRSVQSLAANGWTTCRF